MKKFLLITLFIFSSNFIQAKPDFNILGTVARSEPPTFLLVGGKLETPSDRPPMPEGEGWQWDESRKTWWKWGTVTTTNVQPSYYLPQQFSPAYGYNQFYGTGTCAGGNCPR